jgi:hypothetical protein
MAIVDNINSVDGGCVAIVSDDVAMSRGVLRCLLRVCIAVSMVLRVAWVLKSTVVAVSVVLGVVWVAKSTRTFFGAVSQP